MKLVGIDLSTDPNKTGVSALDEGRIYANLCRGPSDRHKGCSNIAAMPTSSQWMFLSAGRSRLSNPKSVSTDKLGSTAIVGTNLLHALSKNGFRLSPREGSAYAAVIEVYPAASLQAWSLQEEFGLAIDETTKQRLLGNAHCFDALIATLTAREYASGNTFDPPEHIPEETLKTEGWIRIPSRTLQ